MSGAWYARNSVKELGVPFWFVLLYKKILCKYVCVGARPYVLLNDLISWPYWKFSKFNRCRTSGSGEVVGIGYARS